MLLYRSLELLVQKYCIVTSLLLFWYPYMVINVSVQYNGGLLPDIIMLTQYYFHRGTLLIPCRVFVPTANVPT